MNKKEFMKHCGIEESKKGTDIDLISDKCKLKYKKYQQEIAPTSEFGMGNTRFKTNNRIFQVILFIIFLGIIGGAIYFLVNSLI